MKTGKVWKFLCIAAVFVFLIVKCRRAGVKGKESGEI